MGAVRSVYESLGDAHLRLLRSDIAAQLPGDLMTSQEPVSLDEKLRLLTYASTLALSEAPEDRSLAYEIATRIVETTSGDQSLIPAAAFVMGRIGNFPGRQLVSKRFSYNVPTTPDHPLLAFESLAREIGNTVQVGGRPNVLTDFQMDFFTVLEGDDSASISAPTSAGKSFVLSLSIISKVSTNPKANIVYIVPTRALLGQVTRSLLFSLKDANIELPVRCVPIPLDHNARTGCIYVLTQERLISLLQSLESEQAIDTLIVDEAQSVGDGSRGVLLQTAIERVKLLNPLVHIFFASPLAKNPGLLMDYFGTGVSRSILKEKHSPVLQNIILVREVSRNVRQASFSVLNDFGEHSIGVSSLDFEFRGNAGPQKAKFAKSITNNDESTIIYCNIPTETEKTADELCSLLENTADQDVYEFADFLRENIHEEYPLADMLPKGVAYHYGSMPNIVRTRIEQLAKQGKLQYICCTSTLLQGVNLPAKHIIIDRPRKGNAKPMGRADFLNLAGRAGRLLQEFQGNVWCLRPDVWKKPEDADEPCFKGNDTQDIKISFVESFSDGGELLLNVLRDDSFGDSQKFELGVAALGKVFGDFVLPEIDLSTSYLSTPETAGRLKELQRECEKIDLTIPREVVRLNPSVHPIRLQALYDYMSQQDLELLFPIHPQKQGANSRLKIIFQIISRFLEKETNNAFKFDAWLANEWLHDMPLKAIIDNRLGFLRSKAQQSGSPPPRPRDVIYNLLEALQQRIRFKYVKNLRVYKQILVHLLSERGRKGDVDEIIPVDLFLECGSSSPIVLSLMGIGLTRTTALMLKGKIKFPENPTPEACLSVLATKDVDGMDIPAICRKEIQELVGVAK